MDGERMIKMRGQVSGDFTRTVFYNKQYIVKVDFGKRNQSFLEWEMWNKFLPNHKKYFVPTIELGKIGNNAFYSIMKRENFLKRPKPSRHKDILNFIDVLDYYNLGWSGEVEVDIEKEEMYNCGITRDGRVLCYDYGGIKG